MRQAIKKIDFLDLSAEQKVWIKSIPSSALDSPQLAPGQKVLVQTQRAKDLKFYIVIEATEQREEGFIGKVVGPEGYEGPRHVIYPGEYLKFEFDGMSVGDEVWFEEKNVANVF
jgi:hypothetical protein